jgi:hypothetical protein
MKKVIEGWVGKDEFEDLVIENVKDEKGEDATRIYMEMTIERFERDEDYWLAWYPPKKVKITVEVEE